VPSSRSARSSSNSRAATRQCCMICRCDCSKLPKFDSRCVARRSEAIGCSGPRRGPAQAMPVGLAPDMTVEATLQCFGQRYLAHLLNNEFVALADDAEAIHQVRVAVRRLRSTLSALNRCCRLSITTGPRRS
jgi:hypothetical protein